MRSKQTGHVGNSNSEGVGGGAGLVEIWVAAAADEEADTAGIAGRGPWEGKNGSFDISGKATEEAWLLEEGFWNCIDLMKTTWQFSGYLC